MAGVRMKSVGRRLEDVNNMPLNGVVCGVQTRFRKSGEVAKEEEEREERSEEEEAQGLGKK